MAGNAKRVLRIDVDRAAVSRLLDFGEIAMEAPESDTADVVHLVFTDRDVDAELGARGEQVEREPSIERRRP